MKLISRSLILFMIALSFTVYLSLITTTGNTVYAQSNDTVTWNTYNNTEHGFSIDYPTTMNLYPHFDYDLSTNTPHQIYFYNFDIEENPIFAFISAQLSVYPKKSNQDNMQEFIQDFIKEKQETLLEEPQTTTIDKGNIPAYGFESSSTTSPNVNKYVAFSYDDLIYIFGVENIQDDNGMLLYTQMLDSLKVDKP